MFADIEERVLVGGHTHVQMIRRYGDSLIAPPGSGGRGFRSWWPRPVRISPWAEYGVLTGEDGRLSIDLRRTPFDVDAFLQMSLKSGMPHAEWGVQSWSAGGARRHSPVRSDPADVSGRARLEEVRGAVRSDLHVVQDRE